MWKWVLLIAGVLWYMTQRERSAVPIAGNRAAAGAIDHVGSAVNKVIDEAGPAVGKWLKDLLSGSGSSSQSATSSGGTNTNSDYIYWDDV